MYITLKNRPAFPSLSDDNPIYPKTVPYSESVSAPDKFSLFITDVPVLYCFPMNMKLPV